jgi:hypothetical protein
MGKIKVLGLATAMLAGSMHAAHAAEEPVVQSYSVDVEAKFITDRKNRGLSDTFNRPGAELSVMAVHETGLVGYLHLGSVRKEIFPETNGLAVTGALGYRWGNPDAWHFGVGAAREWFPDAEARDTPTGFDWMTFEPTGVTTTKFHTTYGLFEFGYGVLEARYLYVLSEDLRGNNTATVCGSAFLAPLLMGADPAKAMACYDRGFKRTGGSHLLELNIKHRLDGQNVLVAHAGFQKTRNFHDGDIFDYKLGIVHTRWGLDWGAEVAGAKVRDSDLAVVFDSSGKSKKVDRTALILSVAKRF